MSLFGLVCIKNYSYKNYLQTSSQKTENRSESPHLLRKFIIKYLGQNDFTPPENYLMKILKLNELSVIKNMSPNHPP